MSLNDWIFIDFIVDMVILYGIGCGNLNCVIGIIMFWWICLFLVIIDDF